jgi:hypothetical protein
MTVFIRCDGCGKELEERDAAPKVQVFIGTNLQGRSSLGFDVCPEACVPATLLKLASQLKEGRK